jgi:hypothetical protein
MLEGAIKVVIEISPKAKEMNISKNLETEDAVEAV